MTEMDYEKLPSSFVDHRHRRHRLYHPTHGVLQHIQRAILVLGRPRILVDNFLPFF